MGDKWDPDVDAPKTQCTDIRSCGDLCTWFKENPRRCFALTIFLLSFLAIAAAAVAFYAWKEKDDYIFIASGIGSGFISLVGTFHFRTLLRLRAEVDKFSGLNKQFRAENMQLSSEVDRLNKAQTHLSSSQKSIAKSLEINKENFKKFRALNEHLQQLGSNNLEEMGKIVNMSGKLNEKWKTELVKKQRKLLLKVFERVEWDKDADGVTQENWNQFLKILPQHYEKKINDVGDFKSFAGDDMIMQIEEFGDILDTISAEIVKSEF